MPAPTHSLSPAPAIRGGFLLVACQGGAEEALCRRQQEVLPQVSKGVWRRGAVTFRLPEATADSPGFDPPDDFFPDLTFARAVIRSLGQAKGSTEQGRIENVLALAGTTSWDNVHAWVRAPRGATADEAAAQATALRATLLEALQARRLLGRHALERIIDDPTAQPDDLVLDCIIDEEGDSPLQRLWVGWHRANTPASQWPGGLYPVALPAEKVSRAWLKLDEAIATFAIPLAPGQRAVELGCAPGGACQRLLEAGLSVTGIDPALVDERVAAHPRFEQRRMRARDVRLKELRGFDWVVADMNIDPTSTLEAIERVVTAPGSRPKGIIATLKLPEWSRAKALPEWLSLFRGWGYAPTARQLSTGGREICVLALRRASPRRPRHATRRPGG
jgi:23S rRNA (cytidine2498-2'-O)-methyltransferase